MFELLRYGFMQRALLLGLVLALASASIGQVVVLRRLSQLGDALAHSALAGVAAGLLLSANPVLSAGVAALIAALGIELLRRFFPNYSEIAIAIVFSTGIGLAGILSGFTPSGNFSAFLFGSIVAVSDGELLAVSLIALAVTLLCYVFRRAFCYISFDEEGAALSALPVRALNLLFTFMSALTIALASRTVGVLVVSSLLVLPVACAMQLAESYAGTRRLSLAFALFFVLVGLWLSFNLNLKPGGSIVLLSVLGLLACLPFKALRRRLRQRRAERGSR